MAKVKEQYPYRSRQYMRGATWWTGANGGPGEWKLLSDWCNASVGPGKWEFFYNQFVFEDEADYALFLLRWA